MLHDDDDLAEDEGTADEVVARQFFGFSPLEPIDALTLRSRKFAKSSAARSAKEKERVQHHFDVLARLVGIPTGGGEPEAPREPPAAAPPAAPEAPKPKRATPARAKKASEEIEDPYASSAVARSALDRLKQQLDYALNAEVIESTISAYDRLFQSMVSLARILGVSSNAISNAWVRSRIHPPAPERWSREDLETIEDLFVKGLHISLGGTPEYNHPQHRYIANAPESRLGLQFEEIINAIREKAEELLGR
jgi:hypothetical protein